MTDPQPIVLSAAEFQLISEESARAAGRAIDKPTTGGHTLGGFELSRGEFELLAEVVAGRQVLVGSMQLTPASDGSCRATWINATDPQTISSRLIRPAD
jgi:hypothetical protein